MQQKKPKPQRELLLVMSPLAARGIALEWFLKGFEESGYTFHGEIPDLTTNKPVRRMIGVRFTKLWAESKKRG